MTTLNSPHDRFFKTVFGRTEVAAESGLTEPDQDRILSAFSLCLKT